MNYEKAFSERREFCIFKFGWVVFENLQKLFISVHRLVKVVFFFFKHQVNIEFWQFSVKDCKAQLSDGIFFR